MCNTSQPATIESQSKEENLYNEHADEMKRNVSVLQVQHLLIQDGDDQKHPKSSTPRMANMIKKNYTSAAIPSQQKSSRHSLL